MKSRDVLVAFNRGRIGKLAQARTEVSRVALSAEIQTNWMPRTLGAMSLRPGLGYLATLAGEGFGIPFVVDSDDTAIVDLTASEMRVYNSGTTLLTRASVSTTITNGAFTSDISGWTESNDSGADCDWATGGYASIEGTGTATARLRQTLTVSGGETSTAHALRIVVERGPIVLRIGTAAGDDDIFRQAVLRTGTHSIAFTPGATSVYLEFSSRLSYPVLLDSVSVESSGAVVIPTPWSTVALIETLRWTQVGEILFVAGAEMQQRRIERRPNGSWSVVLYDADDGPYAYENTDALSLTPSALSGEITLTASQSLFTDDHDGALFWLSSQGQRVEGSLSADLSYTDEIRVTGVSGGTVSSGSSLLTGGLLGGSISFSSPPGGRQFSIDISGTWSGTLSLQRSMTAPGAWVTVATYTGNTSAIYEDDLDNAIAYYRLGFESGGYSSGTAVVSLEASFGSIQGAVRITGVTNTTTASAIVLKALGSTSATNVWREGAWSDEQGWPEAVAFWEGRLWWLGDGRAYGSVSDSIASFDPEYPGDAGPINRRAGDRPATVINWALALQRLVIGSVDGEAVVRSNSLDEPVTPSNYGAKTPTAKGSAGVPAVAAGQKGYFVSRDGSSIFELAYDPALYDYNALRTTLLVPEIGSSPFTRLAVMQHPDFRLYAVREDGTVGVLIRDEAEDVLCWVDLETDGIVEDVVVLPGSGEDRVFFRVQRTINSSTVRYLERFSLASECVGGTLNLQADAYVTGSGAVTGLTHLEGETVAIWADGAYVGTGAVSSGAVSVSPTPTSWVAGLPYTATFKSAKLARQTQLGMSLTQRSRIDHIGLILANTHAKGLEFGPDFATMDDLPDIEDGAAVDGDAVWESYDEDQIEFPGDWGTDNRICLRATAPKPCTVLAAVLTTDRQDSA